MSNVVTLSGTTDRPLTETLSGVISSRWFQLMTLLLYAFFLNREGVRVPAGNEQVYLLYVYRAWHPHFMAGDWTFMEPTAGHGFFNLTTGWLTLLMPLEWVAWVGRFSCWTLAFIGLLRLGRHFKIPSWSVWLGIMLWMIERQALPTTPWTEWMVGSFEAKCPAYICLVFALDAAMDGKPIVAGLLAGLTFSFHSAVGMWGGAALGWAVLTQYPIRKTAMFSACAIVMALPGLISSLPLITGPHPITAEEAKYLVTQAASLCMDPFTMVRTYVVLLVLMVMFTGVYRWQNKGPAATLLFQFQLALLSIFAFGFVARAIGRFDLVKLFPTRVFVVTALLLFFWQFLAALAPVLKNRLRNDASQLFLAGFGMLLFLAIPSPVLCLADTVVSHLHLGTWVQHTPSVMTDNGLEVRADFRAAASWVRDNTPESALVIAPPWRADAFYFLRRPLIANWHAYRYDDMTGWRNRMESLCGDLSNLDPDDADVGDLDLAARNHYRNLSVSNIASLQQRFGASWLITTSDYPYQKTFSSGLYKVYQLPAPAKEDAKKTD